MRGSVFYSDNRLQVRECDINYNFHREMLKKIKARIGLRHKQSAYCPPAQPLEFHPVHGDNVMLSANNTIAAR